MMVSEKTPSIIKQAENLGFKAGLYNFGKAKQNGIDFFNCGFIRTSGVAWLIVRRSKWVKGQSFGMNDLMAFKLENNQPQFGVRIQLDKRFEGEQWEDARAHIINGKLYISCCNFLWSKQGWSGAHQIISHIDPATWSSLHRYDPVYGGNKSAVGTGKHEKNWHYFESASFPHMVYQASPHVVVVMSKDFEALGEHVRKWDSTIWMYGEIRGGTPAILVGDEFYTFFHSSTAFTSKTRQYHMGCYVFESKPPFAIKRVTIEPLLSGSTEDVWHEGKPPCVFPCGAEFKDGNFFVTMGVNDLACGWCEISKTLLDEQMIDV